MAQAILLEDVEGLGQGGDPVDVSPGYLRNFLIPRKLAAKATPGALEAAQQRRAVAEKAEKARAEREEQAGIPIHIMPNGDTAGSRGAAIEALALARQSGLM